MNSLNIRQLSGIPAALLLTVFLTAGCGQRDSGEYQEFSAVAETPVPEPVDGDSGIGTSASELENGKSSESAKLVASTTNDSADQASIEPDETNSKDTNSKQDFSPGKSNRAEAAGDVSKPEPSQTTIADPPADSEKKTEPSGGTVSKTADPSASDDKGKEDEPVRVVTLLIPERDFQTEGPEEAIRVSYDDLDLLKVLNMEPVTANAADLMPTWLKELDGTRIRIRGFMYPTFEETGIQAFLLARDNQICCFGRNPKIYDLIEISMRKGKTTRYIQNRPFDVVGVFHIIPAAKDGELYQLYQISDAIVFDK